MTETAPSAAAVAELPAFDALELERARATGRGIAFMLLSVALFSTMDGMIKWLGADYPTLQIVFFRSLFAFVPLGFFLARSGSLAALKTHSLLGHLLRAMVGLSAMSIFFYAYSQMPLANVVAIGFAAPLFVTALSVPLLGERVGPRRWSAVAVGFLGVLVMVRPDRDVFEGVAWLALAGTVFYALAMIFVRRLSRTETSMAIVFYFTLACTLVSGAALPFVWTTPDTLGWALLIAVGLLGGLAQLTMTTAFRLAEASVVAPFDYSAMVWTAMIGYLFWQEVPGPHIWLGVAIVGGSGLYIVQREARLGLPRGVARRLQARR